jgi:hypothetical protein
MPLITIWNWQSTEKDKLPEFREALPPGEGRVLVGANHQNSVR